MLRTSIGRGPDSESGSSWFESMRGSYLEQTDLQLMEKRISETIIRDLRAIEVDGEPMGRVNLEHFHYGNPVTCGSDVLAISLVFEAMQTGGNQIHRIPEWAEVNEIRLRNNRGKDFVIRGINEEMLKVGLVNEMHEADVILFDYNDEVHPVTEEDDAFVFECK